MRRRTRVLIVAVTTLVLLAGVLVAADRIALGYAESAAARRLQQAEELTSRPSVSIAGFPFLTQVLAGRLDEVTVTARDLETDSAAVASGTGSSTGSDAGSDAGSGSGSAAGSAGGSDAGDPARLRIALLTAHLHGVTLSGRLTRMTAASATGTVLLSYADLSAAAPAGVTVSYGGRDASGAGDVKVTAGLTLPMVGTLRRSVTSTVRLTGQDTVSLRARSVPGAGLIPELDRLIRSRIDFSRRLTGLPAGITLRSVRATPAGVEMALSGRDVRFPG